MRKRKSLLNADVSDLIQEQGPTLELDQHIKVVSGPHAGKEGKAYFYRTEGESGRLTILQEDGSYIYVSQEDIDFKFEGIRIVLMLPPDEREEFYARIKEIEEGYS